MSDELRRLIDADGSPDALRLGLEAARRDGPDEVRLARLAARLPLGGPGPSGGPAAPSGGPAAPSGGHVRGLLAPAVDAAPPTVLSGLAIGAAVGAVLVGAVWLMPSRSQPPPGPPPAAAVATAPKAAPTAAPVAEAPAIAADAPPAAPPAREPDPEPPRPPASAPAPPRAPAPATDANVAGGGAQAALPDAETETGLLQRAQDALGARPAEALALTDVHRARFPGGALSQEREVIAIGALKALGRGGEARARADRFVAEHPSSAYRRRIEVLVPELRGDPR
ncbi:hypothetical protein [Sorangium cellulosum]|uniref:hypothetical protein n=1 Tax=Sorangium cellulosum TaxID=56 RepID=UPI000421E404|nr:hypothetical protein [Sorangium cellulosum]